MTNNPKKTPNLIPNINIVILGNFNPAILQTYFLRQYKILPEHEISFAEEDLPRQVKTKEQDLVIKVRKFLISKKETFLIFRTIVYEMARDRFQITFMPGADLEIGVDSIRRLFITLPHTPVSALGFNFHAHWKTANGLKQLRTLFVGSSQNLSSIFGKKSQIGGKVTFEDLGAKISFETEKSYKMDPKNPHTQFWYAYILASNNLIKDALAILKLLPDDAPPNPLNKVYRALNFALQGEKEKALACLNSDVTNTAWYDVNWAWILTDLYALINMKQEAYHWLERSITIGLINYPFLSNHDPFIESLRGDDRFKKLMNDVKKKWKVFEF